MTAILLLAILIVLLANGVAPGLVAWRRRSKSLAWVRRNAKLVAYRVRHAVNRE
jgi:hypothetical protein